MGLASLPKEISEGRYLIGSATGRICDRYGEMWIFDRIC